ncbi:HlyD family secretion protein [Salinimicrobium sediminis]|uniref:HlyD family secretion protein n=1 Tax=Salinimicrobium sediminis TaxID=1343891 RepID=A0A285X3J5_9FLAO|nr:efflux RND transporter periplasmic adaptor subunit [Salinimicrobium sediminis]MDX1753867.1 efflux RND transporter periplasmic adaptor subunit [Salinimicrobium sediminis]SOC78949.1 HlyD family secretion protein [Salinimicrobium sediminis]
MKRVVTILILVVIAVAFSGALYYLYSKNQEDPTVYETEKASEQTIVKKTVATGNIVPKEEVLIKPNISGIIEEIYIEAGNRVKAGDLIAKIRVIPNVSSLQSAKDAVQTAKINFDNERTNYDRQKTLFEKGVISANEFQNAEVAYKRAEQNYRSAQQNYEIVRTGTTSGLGSAANTNIRSTVEGMVLDVPVKVGNQVIESNNFNDGTTIATLADVNQMIFEGKVDESEVGKIKEGLPLEVTVGAIENKSFNAMLDYIAPKGVEENGAIQFDIEGTLDKADTTFIRAGLSANASIILARAENVLAIREALVQFDPKTQQPFVEVATGDQQFERREIELGVSDGIFVEVKKGVGKDDKIKVWNQIKPAGIAN